MVEVFNPPPSLLVCVFSILTIARRGEGVRFNNSLFKHLEDDNHNAILINLNLMKYKLVSPSNLKYSCLINKMLLL